METKITLGVTIIAIIVTIVGITVGLSSLNGPTIVVETNTDVDGDGILNELDNCPDKANRDQLDSNHDGVDDVCTIFTEDNSTILTQPSTPRTFEIPTAKISGSNQVTVNTLVTFTADDSEDKDGFVENYQWYVNGNKISEQSFLEYTFVNETTYQIDLVVFDNEGNLGKDSMSVKVLKENPIECPNGTTLSGEKCVVTPVEFKCIDEKLEKPITKITSPVNGDIISDDMLIVSGTVQTTQYDPDSLWIYTNEKITKFSSHNCHWTVTINGLEKGTTVIKAQSC